MTTIATSTAAITAKVMICIISRSATAAPPASGAPRYTPQTPRIRWQISRLGVAYSRRWKQSLFQIEGRRPMKEKLSLNLATFSAVRRFSSTVHAREKSSGSRASHCSSD